VLVDALLHGYHKDAQLGQQQTAHHAALGQHAQQTAAEEHVQELALIQTAAAQQQENLQNHNPATPKHARRAPIHARLQAIGDAPGLQGTPFRNAATGIAILA
jgi:hypothetical protein